MVEEAIFTRAAIKKAVASRLFRRDSDVADYFLVKYGRNSVRNRILLECFPFYSLDANPLALEDFISHLEEVRLPFGEIDHIGNTRWSSDTWTLETSRCLRSPSEYRVSLRRKYGLKRPEFDALPLNHVYGSAYSKLRMHRHLLQAAHLAENLFVCEVGRGLDILLAETVKKWGKIRCYDYNGLHKEPLLKYFGGEIGYFDADSREFDFGSIVDKTILIASHPSIPPAGLQQIRGNQNIVAAIINGEVLEPG